jgi:glycosyltransferase involved in cell wall biosynthesis
MKIFVIGTRGIPNIPGGIETHCQELYPRIAATGHNVTVITRTSYVTQKIDEWHGVSLVECFAPRKKCFEAIVHTFIAILKARRHSPDVVHIHAIGPSLLVPMARMLGLKVVVTNHGPEYNRQKWGRIAKAVLRLGEKVGALFANEIIVVSSIIKVIIRERCNRDSNVIYNGVSLPQPSKEFNFLSQIGVESKNYILTVARLVPEKGLHDLINAFREMSSNYKLVIAGDADHETDYSRSLRKLAAEDDRVILTGYLTGRPLNQVYSHARLFVLPSYHEGLAISLLEALSYGIPVLVSDIPANKEVELPEYCYFCCGEVSNLKQKMGVLLGKQVSESERKKICRKIEKKYNWEKIAERTVAVYQKVLKSL